MNYIKTLTQQKLSLLLALYLGILLNLPIFYRRFDGFLRHSTVTNWLTAVTEVVAIVVLTFFLMRLLSLGGKWFYRVLATLIVLISVAAAYYMAFFNVVIGYGIVASVMTTDTDLSKEVIGYHFILWMVLVSALPLLMIWRNKLSMTLNEQLRTPGQRLKPTLIMLLCVALVWLPIRFSTSCRSITKRSPTSICRVTAVWWRTLIFLRTGWRLWACLPGPAWMSR